MTALIKPKLDSEILAEVAANLRAENIQVFGNRVLVAKFIRTTVGRGYLVASSQTQKEDRWQGKVGLVVAVGPLAFKDDSVNDFCGQSVKEGDWVLFNYGDGSDFNAVLPDVADQVPCKMIKDVEIHGIVRRPESIY